MYVLNKIDVKHLEDIAPEMSVLADEYLSQYI
jgi:hypothetical protein